MSSRQTCDTATNSLESRDCYDVECLLKFVMSKDTLKSVINGTVLSVGTTLIAEQIILRGGYCWSAGSTCFGEEMREISSSFLVKNIGLSTVMA